MLQILLALSLSVAALPQSQTPSDAQRAKAAVAELEKAYKDGQSADRIKAIREHDQILDPQVIHQISRGLQDRDVEVQRAAIEALRFMNHPDALKDLENAAQKEEPMRRDSEIYAELLKAIGQHGNPSSIPILKDCLWSVRDREVIRARLFGLAQIRTEASIDALITLMRAGGRMVIAPFMEDFRLALAMLTGVDQGRSQDLWDAWWNDNRTKFKVDPKPPVLPKPLQKVWDNYWGVEHTGKRNVRTRDEPDKGSGNDKSGGKQ
jgi:HEAT repeats